MKVNALFSSPALIRSIFRISFILSCFGLFFLIYDFGYAKTAFLQNLINGFYFLVIAAGIITTVLRYVLKRKDVRWNVIIFDLLSILVTVNVVLIHFFSHNAARHLSFLYDDNWIKYVILLTFIREFAEQKVSYKKTFLNPAQLFIVSFLGIIVIGTFMLMLPKATYEGLSFTNALFTSTSAVCVTGLAVVDTGTYFTPLGQVILVILIQMGGLGILTFASYFSYFFKGGATYENQLVLTDMTNSQKIGEVFETLKKIIIITFSIEILGGIIIYFTLKPALFQSFSDEVFFSVFHSISAFCNAGFSTLSSSLYQEGFRFNYGLQLVIIALFVLGGLGFPIIANVIKYVKYLFINRVLRPKKNERRYIPWILNINSRITLVTTISLTVLGTIVFYINEYNNTLAEHHGFGKFVTALFGATTPRTAGFNNIDIGALNFSTIMLIFFLMWIGASPASTGGGIKTSTFAIATLNFLSLAKGKDKIEVYRREIAEISVRRAFATISLSLLVIGMGIILISVFDEEKTLLSIAFECFSAYSTVGLSVGITAALSIPAKAVIITIMFIGRVSMLTILIAVFKKAKHKNYRYPTEEITIN
ncbi:TrkH family potassium uptake protein [Flavimarina sp. Hel_I_48]|uniref:TrkH family potassium uptake protein n=1 Tax=Flavimarina sp. Hel_I_48 TaxID=1392488 RepID=UPI00068B1D1B|nr:potassium transporter TrkG [Flavimarina sp. Hel_I_48]